jgi:hypothetical protein
MLIASVLIVVGLAIAAVSLAQLSARDPDRMAQATQPLQSSPPAQKGTPAEAEPGGARPTTPAPEPARPDPDAQNAGAKAALPPAPAEKVAPPIKDKK